MQAPVRSRSTRTSQPVIWRRLRGSTTATTSSWTPRGTSRSRSWRTSSPAASPSDSRNATGSSRTTAGASQQSEIDAAQASGSSLCGEIPDQTDHLHGQSRQGPEQSRYLGRSRPHPFPASSGRPRHELAPRPQPRARRSKRQRRAVDRRLGAAHRGGGLSTGQKNLGYPDRLGYVPAEVRQERAIVASSFPAQPPVRICRRNPDAPGCEIQGQIDAVLNRNFARRPLDSDPLTGDYNRDRV